MSLAEEHIMLKRRYESLSSGVEVSSRLTEVGSVVKLKLESSTTIDSGGKSTGAEFLENNGVVGPKKFKVFPYPEESVPSVFSNW